MVKEEKTIDGFPVRRAKDSNLVARSKAAKIQSKKNTKVISEDDPLVQKTTAKRKTAKTVSSSRPKQVRKTVKVQDEFHEEPVVYEKDLEEEIFGNSEVSEEVIEEAHEDFVAPVETFDLGEDDKGEVSEGRVEEVEDNEIIDIKREKKSKKEARKEKKLAKLEAKKIAEDSSMPEKKKSKKGKVFKIILIVLLVLILGVGIYVYFWGDGILRRMTGGEGSIWSAIGTLTSETYEPLKTDENGRTNILIFGTSGYEMDGSGHDGAQLTDSIMVVSIDQETGDIAMVSMPRDLKVSRRACYSGKINEVYYCSADVWTSEHDEEAGAAVLQDEIRDVLGIDTQYYAHLNWGALVSIVDTLGGVSVVLDEDINDLGWTGAVFSAGVEYTLNGEEALGLARARHGTSYGDFTRGNSQQKLIIAIKDKIMEKGLGLTDIIGILNALGDNVRTNFGMSEIKTGMHLFEEFDLDSIRQIPLVGETYYMTTANINGISYVIPSAGEGRYSVLQDYLALQLKSNPAEREGAELLVLNGTREDGVASEEKARLEKKGYTVKEIDNAPEGEYAYREEVEVYDTSEGYKPETKKALEEFYGVEMKAEAELPNGISGIGYDFIIIIGGAD